MSGTGQRFINAGYTVPKPLIEIDGKPIIKYVVNLFPGETDFVFICNRTHLDTTNMREILNKIAPSCKIVAIAQHKKGPVYAVSQVFNLIDDEEEVIVNYCDFGTYWDYTDFLKHTRNRKADGAIPAYKGFHPHMLGTTNYAFMRDKKQWMLEIKEKEPFTNNRMEEYASNGTYYFRKGKFVKKYFMELMRQNIDLNGEFYVSLIYNLLIQDNLTVSIYKIQHMLQWGTPQDVKEYQKWSNYFQHIIQPKTPIPAEKNSINIIPLAGKGSRFVKEDYTDPKPLIELSGKPMIIQAANYLPSAQKNIFVCLANHLDHYPLEQEIRKVYPDAKIVKLDHVTEGQAITTVLGLAGEDENAPLLVAACDNGTLWNQSKYQELIDDPNVDAIMWSFTHHPGTQAHPEMYGWYKLEGNNVKGVSVKIPVSDNPYNDHGVVGTFYFRKTKYFNDALKYMLKNDERVNGEFYVDTMAGVLADMGLNVKVFGVDDYICWGTPDDYRTFNYWQSFFHKCDWHPYSLEKDITMNAESIRELEKKYTNFEQANKD